MLYTLDRNIIHLHIPAFPIAVERVRRPQLRDRPVAVAPPCSERSLVLAVSPEARKEGIFKGMPLGRALKFCPGLIVLPPNPALTERASRVLSKMAAVYTPLWEPARPGHIYLDISGTDRLWGRAKDTANRLRRDLREQLRLSGVSGNKMVSSIASRILARDGVMDVNHGQESRFMAPLKVDVLPGIGHVRRRVLLEELNITLVREVAAMDMDSLELIFGRSGHVIHQRALGIDPTPVYPPRRKPEVTEEVTLPKDENDDGKLLGILHGLIERCAQRLRERQRIPGTAGLHLRYADQEEAVRRIMLPQTSFWDFDLCGPLEALFFRICRRRVRVRFMRVWFQDFSSPDPQLSLFPAMGPAPEKKIGAIKALDRIREKYGADAVKSGRTAG